MNSLSVLRLSFLGSVGLGLLASVALPATASAQDLRYATTQPGNVIAFGNTLGLAKQSGANGPGTGDSIGTFLSLSSNSVDNVPANAANPWGGNTTNNWTVNGSSGTLTLPVEAEVLYAELVWGGSTLYGGDAPATTEDVTALLDTPVTLSFGGDSLDVAPDASTSVTLNLGPPQASFNIHYYMRSNDVTSFVQSHLSGTYAVEGVPGTQGAINNSTNAAGWTLVLAYRYDGEPIRNMSVYVGGIFVDEDATVDYPVSGFCAPPSEPIEGLIAIATLEGDANRTGDQLAIAKTINDPFVLLSGPNNPENNFFCSQINGVDGLIDTSGTYGTANHDTSDTNPTPSQNTNNVSGARQGLDITHLALSSDLGHLAANQTSAVLRTQTLSDSYMPMLAGISIDVNAPKFQYDDSTTLVDKDSVGVGDTFTLTVNLLNEGSAPANNVDFTVAVPNGVNLQSFTTNGATGDFFGAPVVQSELTTGVPMGIVDTGDSRQVKATFQVTSALTTDILLKPIWHYDYKVCVNDQAIEEEFKAQAVNVDFQGAMGTGGGGTGGAGTGGAMGTGGAGNSDQGGAGGGLIDDAVAEGNGLFRCSASVGSAGKGSEGVWIGLAALGLIASRRRNAKR